ncbi:hypothetical protein ACQPW1_36200 [Nocardia sp. CA-128927]|uniref:hypothetical protein n=1 Tax=Nocardia sp. CA-128927 TaxID=3239975 RepID=UPI003D99C7CE
MTRRAQHTAGDAEPPYLTAETARRAVPVDDHLMADSQKRTPPPHIADGLPLVVPHSAQAAAPQSYPRQIPLGSRRVPRDRESIPRRPNPVYQPSDHSYQLLRLRTRRAEGHELPRLGNAGGAPIPPATKSTDGCTAHLATGLDFGEVFRIVEANTQGITSFESDRRDRQSLVAATRARDYLWIGVVDEHQA